MYRLLALCGIEKVWRQRFEFETISVSRDYYIGVELNKCGPTLLQDTAVYTLPFITFEVNEWRRSEIGYDVSVLCQRKTGELKSEIMKITEILIILSFFNLDVSCALLISLTSLLCSSWVFVCKRHYPCSKTDECMVYNKLCMHSQTEPQMIISSEQTSRG